jgi:tetratricopeptide (TPR) repeat protein
VSAPVRPAVLAVAAAGLAFVAFAPSIGNGFVNYDDPVYITENEHVKAGLSAAGFRWAWTTFSNTNWHPLTWLSLQLDATLFGPAAWGFHLTNVLLHAATAATLFLTLWLMTGATARSFVAAALWAVHPLRVESVAWAAERKDVLCAFFGVLTLFAYAAYAARPGVLRYLGVLAAFAAGLAAKPMLVTWPFLMLVLDAWPLRRPAALRSADEPGTGPAASPARLVAEKLPLLLLVAAACWVTLRAQESAMHDRTLEARLANAVVAYAAYLGQLAWPVDLAVHYPHPAAGLSAAAVAAAAGVLVAITAVAVALVRRAPYLLAGWLWYLGTLVPVLGLVQVGLQSHADRYTYLPQIGLFVALVWAAADLLPRLQLPRWAAPAAVSVLVLVWGGLTWVQTRLWSDSRILWAQALRVGGPNYLACLNYGDALAEAGESEAALARTREAVRHGPRYARGLQNLATLLKDQRPVDEAVREFRQLVEQDPDNGWARQHLAAAMLRQGGGSAAEALEAIGPALAARPNDPALLNERGTVLYALGRLDEAVADFRAALAAAPESGPAHNNLGAVYLRRHQWADAARHLESAARQRPQDPDVSLNLASALLALGQLSEAETALARSAAIRPDHANLLDFRGQLRRQQGRLAEAAEEFRAAARADASASGSLLNLGLTLGELGRDAEARQAFEAAAAREPNWPARALREAAALATHPDATERDGPRAVRLASQVIAATRPKVPFRAYDVLAAAQAECGDFAAAVQQQQRALDALGGADPAAADRMRRRLELYRAGQPFRTASAATPG